MISTLMDTNSTANKVVIDRSVGRLYESILLIVCDRKKEKKEKRERDEGSTSRDDNTKEIMILPLQE